MNLEDVRKAYYDYSGTLSKINRQLALSGIAIVWFFIQPKNNVNFNFGQAKSISLSFAAFAAASITFIGYLIDLIDIFYTGICDITLLVTL